MFSLKKVFILSEIATYKAILYNFEKNKIKMSIFNFFPKVKYQDQTIRKCLKLFVILLLIYYKHSI